MQIYLRGSNALVAEHLLDSTQIGPSLKQRCGKGMSQRVRRDGLAYAGSLGQIPHDIKNHSAGEGTPAAVHKHIPLVAGLHRIATALAHPVGKLGHCRGAHGHHTLLGALARDSKIAQIEIKAADLKPHKLAHTQSTAEQHLDDGTVALGVGPGIIYGREHGVYLGHRQHFRQPPAYARSLKQQRRVVVDYMLQTHEAVKGFHARYHPRLRTRGYAQLMQKNYKFAQLRHIGIGSHSAAFGEPCAQTRRIGGISLARIGAQTPLKQQPRLVALKNVRIVHRIVPSSTPHAMRSMMASSRSDDGL